MTGLQLLLLDALKAVRDNKEYRSHGICSGVESYLYSPRPTNRVVVLLLLREYLAKWPEFSGNVSYPVPSFNKYQSPRNIYNDPPIFGKWSRLTKYGRARWRLLHFLITEIEKDLQCLKTN